MKKIITRLMGMYINFLAVVAPRLAGRTGFYLFCTPLGVVLKDHHRKFLNESEQFSFEHEGVTIQGYRWGTGRKNLLFIHGWQSHTFRWKNYVDSFSKDEFTMYAFDAPGHGLSGGKYLNLPIYSSVIEKFLNQAPPMHTVISHSLGSFAALYTFFRIPALNVNQLIITGTPGEVSEFVKFYQDALGLSTKAVQAIRKSFVDQIDHLPEYFSAEKFARAIPIPGLIIHDEQDEDTPYRHAVDIHNAWKGSKLITTSGLGHNLRSRTVIKEVVEFVNAAAPVERNTELNFKIIQD